MTMTLPIGDANHPDKESKIIDSWFKNAAPWIVAIEQRQIQSRNLVTDRFSQARGYANDCRGCR
jgi:hypothetical protein